MQTAFKLVRSETRLETTAKGEDARVRKLVFVLVPCADPVVERTEFAVFDSSGQEVVIGTDCPEIWEKFEIGKEYKLSLEG